MPSEVSVSGAGHDHEPTIHELKRELAEAGEQQVATAEILRVISRSPTDLQRVFVDIARAAARLCDYVSIFRVVGNELRLAALQAPFSSSEAGPPGRNTLPLTRGFIAGRAVLDRRTIQVTDIQAESNEYPEGSDLARRRGTRTILSVPLIRGSEVIGVISVQRIEARPFNDKQIAFLETFADQAVIAIENTRLFEAEQASKRELQEALEFQTATSDVLNVINRSPNELQPVFNGIVATAQRLCEAYDASIVLREGKWLKLKAHVGPIPMRTEWPLGNRGLVVSRSVMDRKTIHVHDLAAAEAEFPEGRDDALKLGHRSILAVPLVHKGDGIGTLIVRRFEIRPFMDRQVALLTTFADQAVIAIQNARLFEEVQARTRDLTEALEQQTATADVLKVISRSALDLQRVLDALVQSAARLCNAYDAAIYQVFGDSLRLVAHHGQIPMAGPVGQLTIPLVRGSIVGRAVIDRRTIQVADILAEGDEYPQARKRALPLGYRTALCVPLIHAGEAIGVISIRRTEVCPFTERQIELVNTFADQAVIAIENTRLFEEVQARTKELAESLESHTATSDILNVISRSPTDVQPVFDTIAANAVKLCSADRALIYRFDGEFLRLTASHNAPPELREFIERNPLRPGRQSTSARAAVERRTVQILDLQADPQYAYGARDVAPIRSTIAVPMLKGEALLGVITIYRLEVRPFTAKEVALVETFADQAVIAIENTRLFDAEQASKRELTEALEYQTATTDVLNVISRSKFDLQPVLDSIVQTAARLCACDMATIRRREGEMYVQLAGYGLPADYAEYSRSASWHHAGRGSLVGRVLQEGKAVQIPDVLADTDYTLSEVQRRGGFRSTLGVPLLRDADQIGIIVLMRRAVQPFTDKQIELVTAFADQAVIAIENTRLFEEVQSRTAELAKTVEDLEIASQHKSQFVANMSHELRTPLAAILGYAELMQEGFYEPLGQKSLDALTRIRSNGKHLLGLINTVLDIAKIESGQFTLNMTEYAIDSVVETVRSATESLAQNKKLLLTTEVTKPLPLGLGDEQRLTQVLLNLVGNAIKFTDTGGVRVTAKSVNGHFAVSVTDTGPGIPEEHQARIFEQFHQVDSSNTKAKGGTGLGLAIAKQIVEMHGGRIWVESTVGKGSTFQMKIPARAEVVRSG